MLRHLEKTGRYPETMLNWRKLREIGLTKIFATRHKKIKTDFNVSKKFILVNLAELHFTT
jgi:hypothetical protein